jgi:MFS transporter, PAT family, beta-lactamase induction signal transducer AmpG
VASREARSRGNWSGALAVYRQPRLIAVLLMGFSSGLPLALTFGTLSYWLAELGVSLTAIGLFGLVRASYSLKFVWSPLIDRLPIPLVTARFGRRRGWALTIQLLLALAILALGSTDPKTDPAATALAAVVVAFLSASQDIVIDAYRVELLGEREQGAGAAATQVGYRIGMVASTAGALYLETYLGWFLAYAVMAALLAIGAAGVLMVREPPPPPEPRARTFESGVVAPFAEFVRRDGAWLVLVFVVLYKFGDALAGWMSSPFYVVLGFTPIAIANVAKVFGLAASIAGVVAGGGVVYRLGVMPALLVCGVLQMLSNLMYVVQLWAGPDPAVLAVTIAVENVTGGMSSAAFVAYLSRLCHPAFTATQYALLSALAAAPRTIFTASGGWLVDRLGWAPFFVAATLLCLPSLALLLWLMRTAPRAAQPAR